MKRTDINKILVIGSGPIIIGQAAEFDYAGTQACLALKEEGYEVILANSNPATIMTDKEVAHKVYMEPLDLESIAKIIRKERPDALLCSLGGQTGLNLAVSLGKKGILQECEVEVLGTDFVNIERSEDRELFKQLCQSIGEPVLESHIAHTLDECLKYANVIGYPVVIRPAYTLGGTGGGFADNNEELLMVCENALKLSPVTQVLVEKSIKGYKEIEYEMMRDANDTAIVICNMENIDPVGVHTGDSMVVCPSQTLSNKEYQMLRNSALRIVRELDIKGGCNVQFALDPYSYDYFVIEVNPRVSRSSALASKASGYPIARVSAKIAIGLTLDEIDIATTKAAFEPTLDYVVTKISRFPFDKFNSANRSLSTQMKATGEIMSIGRSFEESFLKGIRSLEIGVNHIYLAKFDKYTTEELLEMIKIPTDERIFQIALLFRRQVNEIKIYDATKIDLFFLTKIKYIVSQEKYIKILDVDTIKQAKEIGFSDAYIGDCLGVSQLEIYQFRKDNNIYPIYKMIDTCASEFESYIPYFYSSYDYEQESLVSDKQKVIVLGSGPIRIGQGVEFDYSTVHAVYTLQKLGYEAIVINNNPETVSTDYLVTDKLYFEPLTVEDVMNVVDLEKPLGVICSLGGQTAINLAEDLTKLGVNILGTDFAAISRAENREEFEALLEKLHVNRPKGKTVFNIIDGVKVANELSYPVLVRPSYVLGGRAMKIVYNDDSMKKYLVEAFEIFNNQPVLVDKYISGKEVEVDAICDLERVFIPGIMQHIEKTGVHSGDSISVYPPISLSKKVIDKIVEYTTTLGLNIKIKGLFNIQFIVDENEEVFIIEVNPRSSRTIPFISKVTEVNMADLSTKVIMGASLKSLGITEVLLKNKDMYYVKAPTFSFSKIRGLDTILSPEMKSTGEAIGYDKKLNWALLKALKASNMKVVNYGTIFVTLSDETKEIALPLIKRLYDLGFSLASTSGTAKFLKDNKLKTRAMSKISDGSESILTAIRQGYITYVINTASNHVDSTTKDGFKIRRVAAENNVTTFTSLDTLEVLIDVLEEITLKVNPI